jgi:hypothetical protein
MASILCGFPVVIAQDLDTRVDEIEMVRGKMFQECTVVRASSETTIKRKTPLPYQCLPHPTFVTSS